MPAARAGAERLAEVYRRRGQIGAAFQELARGPRGEVNTLGCPKAALFAFALAVAAYDLVAAVKAAGAAGQGRGFSRRTPAQGPTPLASDVRPVGAQDRPPNTTYS